MSRASKFTLAATGLGTLGIVCFVHWAQEADRAGCYDFNIAVLHFTDSLDIEGYAQRRRARYGEAAYSTRTSSRVRNAKGPRTGVSQAANCTQHNRRSKYNRPEHEPGVMRQIFERGIALCLSPRPVPHFPEFS